MRKTIATLLVFMIFLASCASPALPPTVTPTQRPTLTATLSPTETPTPTPIVLLPTVVVLSPEQIAIKDTTAAENDLNIRIAKEIGSFTVEHKGLSIPVTNLITDQSLDPVITEIKINDGWQNKFGEGSEEALAHYGLYLLYDKWEKNNKGVTYDEFVARIVAGEAIPIELKNIDNGATEEYDPRTITVTPFAEGENQIKAFRFVFSRGNRVTHGKSTADTDHIKLGASLDPNGTLTYTIGIYTAFDYSDTAVYVRNIMSAMPHLLNDSVFKFEKREIWEIIATDVLPSEYSSAIQVVGAGGKLDPREQQYNP